MHTSKKNTNTKSIRNVGNPKGKKKVKENFLAKLLEIYKLIKMLSPILRIKHPIFATIYYRCCVEDLVMNGKREG